MAEVLDRQSEWQGSPDALWLRVEGEIQRRSRRKRQWVAWGAAAAAAVLVVALGAPLLLPGPGGTAPPQVATELQLNRPRPLRPPPPDHPKAKFWTPPQPPKPTPARLFTVKVTEGLKGIATGETVTLRQLDLTYANAGPEPLLQVGRKYLLFTLNFGPGYESTLRELEGATVAEGLKKLRYAVRAEKAIAAALAKVGTTSQWGEEWKPSTKGVPFDLAHFPRWVDTRAGCIVTGGIQPQASYETTVWTGSTGTDEVRLIRRVTQKEQQFETRWTFRVKPDGSVEGPWQSGADLKVSPCKR